MPYVLFGVRIIQNDLIQNGLERTLVPNKPEQVATV